MHYHFPEHLSYRPEIDGLRAIAVLSVIAYHAKVPFLDGGFVGVDIFYVISGYLITKIIVSSLAREKFSFWEFYARRVKRLLPAALVVLLVTVLFGAAILAPDRYVELSKSAVYASVFLANVWFMNNSGYFDQSTEVSPLVHMWSLAVEEQFYLLFPLLVFLAYKAWQLNGIKVVVVLVFVVSLGLSISLSDKLPNFSFYMLPTRAWELCVGALLVLFPATHLVGRLRCGVLAVLGATLLLLSLLLLSQDNIYPGYLAIFPVLGTALVIVSSHVKASPANAFLTTRPMILVGKFSYSAYLWHWPIVVFYRIYISERDFSGGETVVLILASLIAGYLSWRFVEEKFRYRKGALRAVFGYALAAMLVVVGSSLTIYSAKGFPGRIENDVRVVTSVDAMWDWECPGEMKVFAGVDERFCVIGDGWEGAARRGVVWGDSHSLHWAPLLHQMAVRRGISFVIAPLECPPYLNARYVLEDYPKFPLFTEQCTKKHELTVSWLNANPEVTLIVMAAAWSGHVRMLYKEGDGGRGILASRDRGSHLDGAELSLHALMRTLETLELSNKNVLLLGDVPRPNKTLNECLFAAKGSLLRSGCDEPYEYLDAVKVRQWHRASDDALSEVARQRENVTAIIPSHHLCSAVRCPTIINGEFLYKDSNHIRRNLSDATLQELDGMLGLGRYFDNLELAGR